MRRGGEVVTQLSAEQPFRGAIPLRASNLNSNFMSAEGGHGGGKGGFEGSDISAEAILKDLFGIFDSLAIPILKVMQLEEYGSEEKH